MNFASTVRLAIATGVVASGALASNVALADINASTAGGELFLVAENTATNSTFVAGLGVTAASIFTNQSTTSSQAAPITAGFSALSSLALTSTAQTALASFITAAGSTFQWTIIGANQAAAGASQTVQNSMTFLSLLPGAPFTNVANQVSNATLANSWLGIDTWVNDLNASVLATGVALDKASGTATGYFSTYASGVASNWFAATGNAALTLNTAYNFYAMSIGTGGAGGKGNLYKAGYTLALGNNGAITVAQVGGGTVPLPAAAWLLGSGLLGLMGVGRRRAARAA